MIYHAVLLRPISSAAPDAMGWSSVSVCCCQGPPPVRERNRDPAQALPHRPAISALRASADRIRSVCAGSVVGIPAIDRAPMSSRVVANVRVASPRSVGTAGSSFDSRYSPPPSRASRALAATAIPPATSPGPPGALALVLIVMPRRTVSKASQTLCRATPRDSSVIWAGAPTAAFSVGDGRNAAQAERATATSASAIARRATGLRWALLLPPGGAVPGAAVLSSISEYLWASTLLSVTGFTHLRIRLLHTCQLLHWPGHHNAGVN